MAPSGNGDAHLESATAAYIDERPGAEDLAEPILQRVARSRSASITMALASTVNHPHLPRDAHCLMASRLDEDARRAAVRALLGGMAVAEQKDVAWQQGAKAEEEPGPDTPSSALRDGQRTFYLRQASHCLDRLRAPPETGLIDLISVWPEGDRDIARKNAEEWLAPQR